MESHQSQAAQSDQYVVALLQCTNTEANESNSSARSGSSHHLLSPLSETGNRNSELDFNAEVDGMPSKVNMTASFETPSSNAAKTGDDMRRSA